MFIKSLKSAIKHQQNGGNSVPKNKKSTITLTTKKWKSGKWKSGKNNSNKKNNFKTKTKTNSKQAYKKMISLRGPILELNAQSKKIVKLSATIINPAHPPLPQVVMKVILTNRILSHKAQSHHPK